MLYLAYNHLFVSRLPYIKDFKIVDLRDDYLYYNNLLTKVDIVCLM